MTRLFFVCIAVMDRRIRSIRRSVEASVRACAPQLNTIEHPTCFELLGYDFMVDASLNTWLIEVNSNPCLETGCPFLEALIPTVLEQTMSLTLDRWFPPRTGSAPTRPVEQSVKATTPARRRALTSRQPAANALPPASGKRGGGAATMGEGTTKPPRSKRTAAAAAGGGGAPQLDTLQQFEFIVEVATGKAASAGADTAGEGADGVSTSIANSCGPADRL